MALFSRVFRGFRLRRRRKLADSENGNAPTGLRPGDMLYSEEEHALYFGKADGDTATFTTGEGSGPAAAVLVRSDTVGHTNYIGVAPAGSATSAGVWTIRRTVYTPEGAITSNLTATNVAWDDRLTANYV